MATNGGQLVPINAITTTHQRHHLPHPFPPFLPPLRHVKTTATRNDPTTTPHHAAMPRPSLSTTMPVPFHHHHPFPPPPRRVKTRPPPETIPPRRHVTQRPSRSTTTTNPFHTTTTPFHHYDASRHDRQRETTPPRRQRPTQRREKKRPGLEIGRTQRTHEGWPGEDQASTERAQAGHMLYAQNTRNAPVWACFSCSPSPRHVEHAHIGMFYMSCVISTSPPAPPSLEH